MMSDTETLVEKYPWLKLSEDNIKTSWADFMPEGWRKAFGEFFFDDLNSALKVAYPDGLPDDFRILNLKEKWGKLTVYLTSEPEVVSDILFKYEYISSFVCMVCGAPYPFAQMTYGSWVMPLCERCYIGNRSDDINKYHLAYIQTTLRDSYSVCNGPEDFITITTTRSTSDGIVESQRTIDIKDTWEKIFDSYVQRTIV